MGEVVISPQSGIVRIGRNNAGVSASLKSGVSVGRSSVTQSGTLRSTTQAGSSVSGASVSLDAQRDAAVQSSMVLADQDITVQAGRDLGITAADDTQQTTRRFESRSTQAGLMGGLSPNQTLFSDQAARQNAQETVVSQSTSVLSANSGALTLIAGADEQHRGTAQGKVTTEGADLLAGQGIRVEGNSVTLDSALAQGVDGSMRAQQRSTTIGAQLAGTVGSRITSAVTMAEQSGHTDNERLANAQRLKGSKTAYDAYKLLHPAAWRPYQTFDAISLRSDYAEGVHPERGVEAVWTCCNWTCQADRKLGSHPRRRPRCMCWTMSPGRWASPAWSCVAGRSAAPGCPLA